MSTSVRGTEGLCQQRELNRVNPGSGRQSAGVWAPTGKGDSSLQATGRDTRVFRTLQTVALLDICWFPKKRQEQKSGNKLCLGGLGSLKAEPDVLPCHCGDTVTGSVNCHSDGI